MICLIEPASRSVGMFVPAYPLPLIELASLIKARRPFVDLQVVSVPFDYGLPLSAGGRDRVVSSLVDDLQSLRPEAVGISCTAIAQAEEAMALAERIREHLPKTFIFMGGYFPTLYAEEILDRTLAVDALVEGEGEAACLAIVDAVEKGLDPRAQGAPNLAWRQDGRIERTPRAPRFDLREKGRLDLSLLKSPGAFDVTPYAFSRGCPFGCTFCMEESIRPRRLSVPDDLVSADLQHLAGFSRNQTVLVSDALFKSFHLLPLLREIGLRINFETRCDVLDPGILEKNADVIQALALGFESASYDTLRRMNKLADRDHYRRYLAGARAIFQAADAAGIPIMVFMIAGFPGDSEKDLQATLSFAESLAASARGSGGFLFKIGECHVYPKTKLHDLVRRLPGVVFDEDGVFGQNVVRRPSKNLSFETVLDYAGRIYRLSHPTAKLEGVLRQMMPFFRLPAAALRDDMIVDKCCLDGDREVFDVRPDSLALFRERLPFLLDRHRKTQTAERESRQLDF
jgi:pyruvate-formate lyase-activating enzyme